MDDGGDGGDGEEAVEETAEEDKGVRCWGFGGMGVFECGDGGMACVWVGDAVEKAWVSG